MLDTERSRLRRGRIRLLSGVAGGFLLLTLAWNTRTTLAGVISSANPALLALAVLLGIGQLVVQGLLFATIAEKHGSSAPRISLVMAFIASQPGKYIPGKIWSVLVQKAALGGDTRLLTVTLANLELTATTLVQMTSLGIACIALGNPVVVLAAGISGWLAGAWAIRTKVVMRALYSLRTLRGALGDACYHQTQEPRWRDALQISAASMTAMLITSWLVLLAMGKSVPLELHGQALGTLFLGFAASILTVVVPAGLGVREAATVAIGSATASVVQVELLLAIAIFARVWQILVDLSSVGIVGLWMAFGSPPERRRPKPARK